MSEMQKVIPERDRPDLEITERMVEAGIAALRETESAQVSSAYAVEAIFAAMTAARPLVETA